MRPRLHELADFFEALARRDTARAAALVDSLLPRPPAEARTTERTHPSAPRVPLGEEARAAVGHRALLEDYARRIEGFIARFRRRPPAGGGASRIQRTLVSMSRDDAAARWAGALAIHNDEDTSRSVTFLSAETVELVPRELLLLPRESRQISVFSRSAEEHIEILFDGRPRWVARLAQVGARSPHLPGAPEVSVEPSRDELDALLLEAQLAIIAHPLAAQALFRSFVAEGRRYAETPEGARWRDRLAGSELIRRGRTVWEVLSQKVLEEEADTILPGKLLEAFVRSTEVADVEPTLLRTMEVVFGGETEWPSGID